MKKSISIFVVLVLLLLVGCSITPQNTPPAKAASNAYSQANLRNGFVETPEGYYYQNDNLIYFCQRGGDAFYPLCSKPNCAHNDDNCNAWCGVAFGYYNDALYAVLSDATLGQYDLVRMNPDGTDHTVVTHFAPRQGGGYQFYVHQGKLYIYASADLSLPLEEQTDRLILLDLSDNSQTEPFSDFFREGNRFSILSLYGGKLYVLAQEDPAQEDFCVMELDSVTGATKKLLSLQLGIVYATDTTLCYLEPGVGFRECDLKSGEIKDCGLPVNDAWWAAYDEDYIYLMGYGRNDDKDHTLYFLSRDYELLDQVELTNDLYYNFAASDRLYFSENFGALTYYLDKSEIGTHELILTRLNTN